MEAFRAAAQIARDIGDATLLASAAVGFEEACWRPGITDEGAVELLEEASGALGSEDSELRVMLLAGLGRAYAFLGNYAASDVVRHRAITMARSLGDRLGLATVLVRSYWSLGDGNLDQTLEMLAEARDLAEGLGASDLQTEAMEWRGAGLIARGDLRVAERELADVHALAARQRQPFSLHVAEHYASTIALCVGQLAEAEAAANALARVEPPAHRPGRHRHLRDPDVRDPTRAGAPGRARPGREGARRRRGDARRVAPGLRRAAGRAGDGGRRAP